jgi:hypothetical protein
VMPLMIQPRIIYRACWCRWRSLACVAVSHLSPNEHFWFQTRHSSITAAVANASPFDVYMLFDRFCFLYRINENRTDFENPWTISSRWSSRCWMSFFKCCGSLIVCDMTLEKCRLSNKWSRRDRFRNDFIIWRENLCFCFFCFIVVILVRS